MQSAKVLVSEARRRRGHAHMSAPRKMTLEAFIGGGRLSPLLLRKVVGAHRVDRARILLVDVAATIVVR